MILFVFLARLMKIITDEMMKILIGIGFCNPKLLDISCEVCFISTISFQK